MEKNNSFSFFIGGFPSWPKGVDCKSISLAFGGSNPPPPTIYGLVVQWLGWQIVALQIGVRFSVRPPKMISN